MIDNFNGQYRFLSNFAWSDFTWYSHRFGPITVPTVEHAYQAEKATNRDDFIWVLQAKSPGEAKRRGRELDEQKVTRPNWHESIKYLVMQRAVYGKFRHNNNTLGGLLLLTGKEELIEGNTWHDQTWGDCHCNSREDCKETGGNWLGKMLMGLRDGWYVE